MPSPTRSLLKLHSLRITPVRVGVLDLLAKSGQPLSVPSLLAKMKGVDTVTVYRTLNSFQKKGIVHRVRSEDRSWRYALTNNEEADPIHKHPHFVCDSCGKVECLQDSLIPKTFIPSLKVDAAYEITFPEVVLHGSCPKCR